MFVLHIELKVKPGQQQALEKTFARKVSTRDLRAGWLQRGAIAAFKR